MRSAITLFWLVGIAALSLLVGGYLLEHPVDVSPIIPDPTVTATASGTGKTPGENVTELSKMELSATTERPLFSRSRRKFVPPPPPKPAKPIQTAAIKKPSAPPRATALAIPPPDFTLIGVSISKEASSALLTSSGGENKWVVEGDSINSWTVADIDNDSVGLENGGRSVRLHLYEIGGR
ncbi:hypothetical protein [Hoeflea poritis]|uniref:Type II secretion system protein GspC N-terminal domain-containing protein n=1 Tax=Hoeflea poritis TaxID=2993659 RepID=A0ABT4VVV4_9HYPH|nr:hypothetical protein [Hoeflea poritis]MDA4848841.1 hypothetical protein [Hoeflea poritis]